VQATPACRAPNGWIRPSRTDGTAVGLVLALFSPAEQAACSQNRLSFIFLSTSVFSSEFALTLLHCNKSVAIRHLFLHDKRGQQMIREMGSCLLVAGLESLLVAVSFSEPNRAEAFASVPGFFLFFKPFLI
jgi:hypothetical protein